jgi:hypothetical protein
VLGLRVGWLMIPSVCRVSEFSLTDQHGLAIFAPHLQRINAI